MKGIICFENEPYEFILQGVGGGFELNECDNLSYSNKSFIVLMVFPKYDSNTINIK